MADEDLKIKVRGLKKRFGGNVVLDGIDLDVPKGKSLVVIGGSGTGKSVMIKCILGIIEPDAGSILIDGEEVVGMSASDRERVRRKFGMLFQGAALFDSLPVWENVAFGLIAGRGMNRAEAKQVALRTLAPELPPSLDVGEDYGKIAWSVRGIYDAYIGWFDGDPASMFPVSPDETYAELARLAGGADSVAACAQALIADHRAATALRLTSAALAADPASKAALEARIAALEALLATSENTNENGWLRKGLFDAKAALAGPATGEEP